MVEETVQALCEICGVDYTPHVEPQSTPKPTPVPAAPKAGDTVQLTGGKLYTTARGSKYVTRTGTFWVYDGQKVGNRYRVTNRADRVGKSPAWANVSGWVDL